jgi:hypothetical protein
MMGSKLSDLIHDVAGWAAAGGNEPGNPLSRKGRISDEDLANELAVATLNAGPQPITIKQAMLLGAGGLVLFLAMRKR